MSDVWEDWDYKPLDFPDDWDWVEEEEDVHIFGQWVKGQEDE